MVQAQPKLRIPRPELLPLRLRELLWDDLPRDEDSTTTVDRRWTRLPERGAAERLPATPRLPSP
jgi:hypothetical protein